jgi:tRNA nucleotidyltransferase (CCA-adding enzyme)
MNISALIDHHPYLKEVINCIQNAGGIPYLVGGSVRDLHLGTLPKDLDIEVSGLPKDALETCLSKSFRIEYIGHAFGVFIIKGLPVDIAIPRTEIRTGSKHTDFEITCDPFLSIEEAAARRDFTINSIYLNLVDGKQDDPYGGIQDLDAKILRHTSEKFPEDALRVYRAMQFIARFDLDCAPETLQLCRTIDGTSLPIERIFAEFEKLILKGINLSKGLEFLKDCGWIRYFPELEALIDCQQDPIWHPEGDVWTHTLLSMNAFAQRRTGDDREDLIVGLAVLAHDLGKPETSFEEGGRIRSPRHDIEGVKVAQQFLSRITRNRELLESVPVLVREHMIPLSLQKSNAGDAALRRLALRVGRVDRLLRVCQADREGRSNPWEPQPFPEGDWLKARMDALKLKNVKPKAILLGRDLIAIGLKPGPQFGKLLEILFQAQLDGAFETRKEGIKYLKTMLKMN